MVFPPLWTSNGYESKAEWSTRNGVTRNGPTFERYSIRQMARCLESALRKPEERAFRQFNTYDITDAGKWTVNKGPDFVEFTHQLSDTLAAGG